MASAQTRAEMEQMFGFVPGFMASVPDALLDSEWEVMKGVELSDETAIPNKYKELIGLAVSAATRCRYCAYFHTEAARLFGATEDEINEAALMAKFTMGWSTYIHAVEYDFETFKSEVDRIAAHIKQNAAAPA